MTIKIEVECDGMSCCNSVEMTGTLDSDIKHAGFHSDPTAGEYHYCSKCWAEVKNEIPAET